MDVLFGLPPTFWNARHSARIHRSGRPSASEEINEPACKRHL